MMEDLTELDVEDGLTDWEVGFIESVGELFDEHLSPFLTDKQRTAVRQLWDKYCRGVSRDGRDEDRRGEQGCR